VGGTGLHLLVASASTSLSRIIPFQSPWARILPIRSANAFIPNLRLYSRHPRRPADVFRSKESQARFIGQKAPCGLSSPLKNLAMAMAS
jgi:hypothetical protein